MEITDEELERFNKALRKVNNSIEDEIMGQADRLLAMQLQLIEVEKVLGELATIAQQTAKPPS